MKHRELFTGYVLGMVCSLACAGVTQVPYYGMNMSDTCYDEGSLLGKQGKGGWPDLSLDECKPDAEVKGKCVVQLSSDYFAKDAALQKCQADLIACQRGT